MIPNVYEERLARYGYMSRCSELVITTAQVYPKKPGIRFLADLNPACGVSEVCGDEILKK